MVRRSAVFAVAFFFATVPAPSSTFGVESDDAEDLKARIYKILDSVPASMKPCDVEVYVVDDPGEKAAMTRRGANCWITVGRDFFETLDDDEVLFVVFHEVGHMTQPFTKPLLFGYRWIRGGKCSPLLPRWLFRTKIIWGQWADPAESKKPCFAFFPNHYLDGLNHQIEADLFAIQMLGGDSKAACTALRTLRKIFEYERSGTSAKEDEYLPYDLPFLKEFLNQEEPRRIETAERLCRK